MTTLDTNTDWTGSYTEISYGIEFSSDSTSIGELTILLTIKKIGKGIWEIIRSSPGIIYSRDCGLSIIGKDKIKYLETISLDNSNAQYQAIIINKCSHQVLSWKKITKQSNSDLAHVTFSTGKRIF